MNKLNNMNGNGGDGEKKENSICDEKNVHNINELEKLEQTGFKSKILPKVCDSKMEELPPKFKEILLEKEIKEYKSDLPYIVGYKGFRRDVKSGNYYGKNFIDTSMSAKKSVLNRKK